MRKEKTLLLVQPRDDTTDRTYAMVSTAAVAAGVSLVRAFPTNSSANDGLALPEGLKRSSLVVVDLTNASPNMMYELGLIRAEGKPVIIIGNGVHTLPMAAIRTSLMLSYRLDERDDGFIDSLTRWIPKLLPGSDAPAAKSLAVERANKSQVFISYCHVDREYLNRLLVHLKPLEREGKIDVWADTKLRSGDKWRKEIELALSKANAAVLLISADFMASDFIANNELPPLLRSAEERGTRIFPLLVRASRFARAKNLNHFQAVNDPKNPISALPISEQESVYDSLAEQVEQWLAAGSQETPGN